MLPPLMFSEDEIEALVLGSRWVAERADEPLGEAARNALAKIAAVLPDDLKDKLEASDLLIGPGAPIAAGDAELPTIRARHPQRAQAAHRLRRRQGAETRAHHLAVRARLLRPRPRRRGVVRDCAQASGTSAPTASAR